MTQQTTRPRLQLVGTDGNAFAILGHAQRAAKRAGWTVEQWEAFRTDATSCNYDHLLATVLEHFDVH